MRLLVARKLDGTSYERLRGRRIRLPLKPAHQPSVQALDQHKAASIFSVDSCEAAKANAMLFREYRKDFDIGEAV